MTVNVHSIKVAFTREKQPKDYEKSAPFVELSASVEDETDHIAIGKQLMADACGIVYSGLGMDVPASVADKLGEGASTQSKPAANKRQTRKATTKKEEPAAKSEDDSSDVPDDKPAEKPAEEKTKNTKAETKSKAKEESSDLPDDDDKPAAKSDGNSDVPDDDGPADTPEDEEDPNGSGTMTSEQLQSFITGMVSSRKVPVATVKEILSSYGASRTSDVSEENRPQVKQDILDAAEG